MIANIEHIGKNFRVDLRKPLDISIPLSPKGPRAWYVEEMRIAPVLSQQFTGSVKLGGNVNFCDIHFNPHGHGTHTESVGHISVEQQSVNLALEEFFFIAELVSITPEIIPVEETLRKKGDHIITLQQVMDVLSEKIPEALVIRTLPNDLAKTSRNYSDTNFTYIEDAALAWLAAQNVQHLLVDLPSVDREKDEGLLKAHHAFWGYPTKTRLHCTITEFVFVKNEIADGTYLLNLQTAPFENDATPSRPLLFAIIP